MEPQSGKERGEACWRETPNMQERHASGRAIHIEKEEGRRLPEEADLESPVRRKARRLRVLRENTAQ